MEHPVVLHTELLTQLSESTKSAHKRIDDIAKIIDLIHDTNVNIKVIVNESKHQGEKLTTIVETMIKQGDKIDLIEERMETKEAVGKLVDRVVTLESKDGKKAETLLTQIKWLLICLPITAIFALLWSRIGG